MLSKTITKTQTEQRDRPTWGMKIKRWIRLMVRLAFAFSLLLCVLVLFVFVRTDIPNQTQILGQEFDTSLLARLDGNHVEQSNQFRPTPSHPTIIGHRGSGIPSKRDQSRLIGNTETAIQAAIDAKIDWIEIDVRITKSGELVLFHDRTLGDKLVQADGSAIPNDWRDLSIADLTWSELKTLRLDNDKREPIPLLDDILKRFDDPNLKWVFDIKSEERPSIAETDRLNRAKKDQLIPVLMSLGPERVLIFGNATILGLYQDFEQANDEVEQFERGLLMLKRENVWTFYFERAKILSQAKTLNAKYLVLPGIFAERSFVKAAKENGLEVLVWDCEHPTDQKNFVARGATGLIVDTPQRTKENFSPK